MSEKSGKSRRRFLADMLFLGGGVTAASLLAKSTLLGDPQPEPTATPDPDIVRTRGATVAPEHEEPVPDGNFVIPEDEPQTEECPPQIKGKVKLPEPNPAGGKQAPPPLENL